MSVGGDGSGFMKRVEYGNWEVEFTIISASKLLAMDKSGTSDPYVRFYFRSGPKGKARHKGKTPTIKKTLEPVWNYTYRKVMSTQDFDKIHLEVYDWDRFSSDDFIGRAVIDLRKIVENDPNEVVTLEDEVGLETKSGSFAGTIKYKLVIKCPEMWMKREMIMRASVPEIYYGCRLKHKDPVDIDLSIMCLRRDGTLANVVYYANLKIDGIQHMGDNVDGVNWEGLEESDLEIDPRKFTEVIYVKFRDLWGMNRDVYSIVLVASLHAPDTVTFSDLEECDLVVLGKHRFGFTQNVRFDITKLQGATTVVLGYYTRTPKVLLGLNIYEFLPARGLYFPQNSPFQPRNWGDCYGGILGGLKKLGLFPSSSKIDERQRILLLRKGENYPYSVFQRIYPRFSEKIKVGLGWDVSRRVGSIDLDSHVYVIEKGVDKEIIYYGKLRNSDGSIIHHGDNLTGEGEGLDEEIDIYLDKLPPSVNMLIICINIFTSGRTFRDLDNAFCVLLDIRGRVFLRYDLDDLGDGKFVAVAAIYRGPDGWSLKALGDVSQSSYPGAEYYKKFFADE